VQVDSHEIETRDERITNPQVINFRPNFHVWRGAETILQSEGRVGGELFFFLLFSSVVQY